jgi:hypothetical protein
MANVSRPNGYRPVKHLDGSAWNGQTQLFSLLAANATAVGVGDLVSLEGAADANGVASITRLANGSTGVPVGVVVGFLPDYSNLAIPSQYRAASTARYALVCVDPTVVYEAQATGTFVIAADMGLNAGSTLTAVSTTTGLSGMQIDLATKQTTSTLPLKIIGFVQRPDNDITDTSNPKLLVTINNHALSAGTTGV